MKIRASLFMLLFAIAAVVHSQQISPDLAALDSATVQAVTEKADTYQIDREQALTNYKRLFETNWEEVLHGLDFFEKKKAFDIAALALPKLSGPARTTTTKFLLKKQHFDVVSFNALIREMERLSDEEPVTDEQYSGNIVMKSQISKIIAQWLGLPQPQFDSSSNEAVEIFIRQAKEKAATMKTDWPN